VTTPDPPGHSFTHVPRHSVVSPAADSRAAAPSTATTLRIGEPDSAAERQAEALAALVVRRPNARGLPTTMGDQHVEAAAPSAPAHAGLEVLVRDAVRSPSRPVPGVDRSFMEHHLGADFSSVRIHEGVTAARSAQALGARAYTARDHVIFAHGMYRPGTFEGRRILAHELVHTLQQGAAPPAAATARVGQSEPVRRTVPIVRPLTAMPTLQRQAQGGPYHPPEGFPTSCSMSDSCAALSLKVNYLAHTIFRHRQWDIANPRPGYPHGRHHEEIQDLQRALENCKQIHNTKCTNQPRWIPAEQEQEEEDREREWEEVKRRIFEALPYAVAILAVAALVACFATGVCGAAILAGAVGAAAAAVVILILEDAGITVVGDMA
jgi:hypothetical protein